MSASDYMNNQKANRSKKSNLNFQALSSEKQHVCIRLNESSKSKSKQKKQLNFSSAALRKATSLHLN